MMQLSEKRKETLSGFRLSQNIRLADILIFSPVLFLASLNKELHPSEKYFLMAGAGLVAIANGKNYLDNQKTYNQYRDSSSTEKYIDEVQKTNLVRILNISVFSPFIVYIGIKNKSFKPAMRYALIVGGAMSIIYNGY